MTYIAASRDALASALDRHLSDRDFEQGCRLSCGYDGEDRSRHIADALIASGAVVAADSLADDEALVLRVTHKFCEPSLNEEMYADFARDHLRALAAALEERAQ